MVCGCLCLFPTPTSLPLSFVLRCRDWFWYVGCHWVSVGFTWVLLGVIECPGCQQGSLGITGGHWVSWDVPTYTIWVPGGQQLLDGQAPGHGQQVGWFELGRLEQYWAVYWAD